ncbi:MAG: ATP-binding protein [Clostridia bacterium]|nr:ATP-binding protein [Clostridia bacterium]
MTRSEHVRALLEEYARQRAADEADLEARVAEACAREPRIAQLRSESAELALSAMRSILTQQSLEQRTALASNMKRQGQGINAKIRELLHGAGLPEDQLEPRYRCDKCRDTGYVGDAPARFCDCFEARLKLRQYEDGSMAGTDEQNFERFDADRIPEENGQREQMILTRKMCEEYADRFPQTDYRNLLLTGAGGLGKTFLLNSIFERVISRGGAAVRITAFRMFEAMRQRHMGSDEKLDGFSALIEAPLLLIDDLGTEPMMRNITVEYLFTLLNERIAAKRHTVIATNLTPVQIKERYGERVASRLLDRSACRAVQLKGKDLRSL